VSGVHRAGPGKTHRAQSRPIGATRGCNFRSMTRLDFDKPELEQLRKSLQLSRPLQRLSAGGTILAYRFFGSLGPQPEGNAAMAPHNKKRKRLRRHPRPPVSDDERSTSGNHERLIH